MPLPVILLEKLPPKEPLRTPHGRTSCQAESMTTGAYSFIIHEHIESNFQISINVPQQLLGVTVPQQLFGGHRALSGYCGGYRAAATLGGHRAAETLGDQSWGPELAASVADVLVMKTILHFCVYPRQTQILHQHQDMCTCS